MHPVFGFAYNYYIRAACMQLLAAFKRGLKKSWNVSTNKKSLIIIHIEKCKFTTSGIADGQSPNL
jgi:hypothetical protein